VARGQALGPPRPASIFITLLLDVRDRNPIAVAVLIETTGGFDYTGADYTGADCIGWMKEASDPTRWSSA
jgi:hypothetical protein